MQSILSEITNLRQDTNITVDFYNSNRYRLVVEEKNGTKTGYYFSTPIYNLKTRKLVDMKYSTNGETICVTGSNANITLSKDVIMKNADGAVLISLPQKPIQISSQKVRSGSILLSPTTNGITFKCDVRVNNQNAFTIETEQPYLNVRANNKSFTLMKEKFKPLVIVSSIGAVDSSDNVIAPAKVEYQKLSERKFRITVSSTSPLANSVLFEVNLYENKLFQDTTVESMNPTENNAYGGVGFIGNTSVYGEQWLYSRIDYSRIPEILDKRVHKAVLRLPKLNLSNCELSAFEVTSRFCSFGSNWNNKIASGELVSNSQTMNGYQSLDITPLILDSRGRTDFSSEGIILKSKIKGSGFSVITTGDSYFAPQILEINYW